MTKPNTATQYARAAAVILGCVSFFWPPPAAHPAAGQTDARAREQAHKAVTEAPRLFRERSFTCATLAEAVNHFVSLGEDGAIKELDTLASDKTSPLDWDLRMPERIGWVCRVLFDPRGQEPLRPPIYGALNLPRESMPLQKWPLYPDALSGATYFVLTEGYVLGGLAEDPKHYIAYCRENGIFRKTPVRVPTRDQALKDAATLRRSGAWKAIKWQVSGPRFSYTPDEQQTWKFQTWKFILGQAESIPAR